METRQLGPDGPQVPVIGLGAWPLGGGRGHMTEASAIQIVRDCIDQGITLIDTAQSYRSSETVIGKALQDGYRDRCFLATKASFDFTPGGIRASVENSLKALQTDVIDLYQIHQWPDAVPVEETLGEAMRLRDEGKLRWIGVSNFSVAQTERACQVAPIHSTQPLYSLFDRQIEADLIPYCTREGIGILPYSPLAQGLLTGKYRPDATFPPDDERAHYRRFKGEAFARYLAVADKLAGVARDKGLTLPQLAVAWLLRIPAVTCVLVGMGNPGQVTPALGASGVTFTEAELARIDAILADVPDVAIYS